MLALVEHARATRKRVIAAGDEPWLERSFPQQLAFVNDPAKRINVRGTRRAGKTKAIAFRLCRAVRRQPHLLAPYITPTIKQSVDNIWADIVELNQTYDLDLTPSLSDHRWYTKEGGAIWLAGCKDQVEAEKFRGKKYSEVDVDETGTFRPLVLKWLIGDVLDAALTDCDAPLLLSGTPGPVPSGYFYEVTDGELAELWSRHHWSVRDNPYHPFGRDPEAFEAHMRKLGLKPGDPTREREWEGRWCRDDSVLVYPYDPRKNAWDRVLPAGQVRTILGIDFGYTSPSAFTVSSSIRGLPDVWLRCSYGLTQLLPGQIAAEIHRLKQRFQIHEIYGDGGGLGITIIKQLQQDFGIPIVPADKQDKAGAIARVRQLLTSGLMHVDEVECAELLDEQSVLTWDKDHKGHNPDQHDHRSDSVLYSTRPHDLSEVWEREPPRPGTREYDEAWAKSQRDKLVRATKRRR